MDADETCVCLFLKGYPGQYVAARQICRRADTRRRYREEPQWAYPILRRLVEQGVLEADENGHYRLVPGRREEQKKRRRWVSPQIQRILEKSGKTFEIVSPEEDSGSIDQHYPE